MANIVGVTGVGKILAESLAASPIPVFLIPFLITGLSKFAQGSASVAGIMAAGLTLPLFETGLLSPLQAFLFLQSGTISLSIESLEKVAYNRGELYVKEIHIVKGALL